MFRKKKTDIPVAPESLPAMAGTAPEAVKPRKHRKPHPVRNGVLLTFLYFIIYTVGIIVIHDFTSPYTPGWSESFIQIFVRLPIGLAIYKVLQKRRPAETIRKIPRKRFLAFLVLHVALVQLPIQAGWPSLHATADALAGQEAAWSEVLNVLLLGPIVEEVIFRGALFGLSRRRLDFWPAAITNGILFGLTHFSDPINMMVTAMVAVLFCALVEATGRIRYGIALHLAFNWCGLLAVPLYPYIPALVALPVFAVGIAINLVLIIRKDRLIARLLPD